ncbi:MAG: MFS transporter [Bifidobacterium aquikefiri]|uniref:Major facilitator superfamily protein n=1 Tax=Bifidobacterium aquikefiri TaxID=1653207 RepID=A0A261G8X4_9BIFI|nr:MFS transporter [Bifidobacterium aquikefiri]OZG67879.1 major facilitator superfamily protein [Bifidobacterium aquikefiri]
MTTNTKLSTNKPESPSSIVGLMIALLVAVFAFQLNTSMLSPALVTMQRELNTTASQVALTQTVFFTAAALFSLFLPRLADSAGRKKVLIGMLVATVAGCIISAVAVNVPMLMIGRVLQGVCGPIVPLCLIMLHVRVPDDKRYARLMAIITSVNGGIAGVDALLGGWLAAHYGFRSIFWTMAAIALIAVIMTALYTHESWADTKAGMDWIGAVLLVIAIGALLLAVDEIEKLAAANWVYVIIMLVIAVVAFIVFWNVEKRKKEPMVTTLYLKQRRTWGLLLTTLLTMTGVFAIMNGIVPAIAQDAKFGAGLSADVASLATLTPYALAGLVFGPVAGWLTSRYGYHKVLRYGLVATAIGVIAIMLTASSVSVWALVCVSIFVGITYAGTVNIMLNGLGIVLSPADNTGYLPGLNAGAFNLGAGLSFAILYAVMTQVGGGSGTMSYVFSVGTGLVLVVLALVCSFFIPSVEKTEQEARQLAD